MKILIATIMLASSASLSAQGTFFVDVFRDARRAGDTLPAPFPLPPGSQGVVDTAVSYLPQPLDPPSLSSQENCVLTLMIRRPLEPIDGAFLPAPSPTALDVHADEIQPFVQRRPWLLSEPNVASLPTLSPVPEPSALALTGLVTGVLLAAHFSRRKRQIPAQRV